MTLRLADGTEVCTDCDPMHDPEGMCDGCRERAEDDYLEWMADQGRPDDVGLDWTFREP